MNWQQVRKNWSDVRQQVHSKWDKLTDADMTEIAGQRDELIKRLCRRYAIDQRKAAKEAENFVKTLN